ncbi:MAG: hypothetical protein IT426_20145 [Pirellulales bacterium]|nr:hypothetical protein [Pirellulales bacterium]
MDREIGWDEEDGILCRMRTDEGEEVVPLTDLELRRTDPNYQLVDDFAAWFFGDLADGAGDDDELDGDEEPEADDELDEDEENSLVLKDATWRDVAFTVLKIVAVAVSFGTVVGAAVAAMPWARWAACIGGCVWGLLMAVAHVATSEKDLPLVVPQFRKGLGGFIGLVIGAVQGALFGIMVAAFIGAVLGGIVGLMLRRLFRGKKWLVLRIFPEGVLFAAACGVAGQAIYLNRVAATNGLWSGALIGLGCGVLFCLISLPLAFLSFRKF